MTYLKDLARRVSELQGPSREVDAEIAKALGWRGIPNPTSAGGLVGRWYRPDGSMSGHEGPPSYTASLDAAMTLVTDGWMWSVGSDGPDDEPWACVTEIAEPCRDISFDAATPALALTAAALIARSEA